MLFRSLYQGWIISGELVVPSGRTINDLTFEWVHRGMPWWDPAKEISGNVAATDVAGGLRSLGDANIVNSTFSGNVSTAWHGGAIFHTDGQLTVINSTFTGNSAPVGTAAGIVVATFGGGTPNLTLTNTILANPVGGLNCAIENQGGAGTITSGGHNIDDDGSCNLTALGDQPFTNPLLDPLANRSRS